LLVDLSRAATDSVVESFERWASQFTTALLAAHPPSVARQVAARIRNATDRPRLDQLAHEFNVTPARLQRDFRDVYGMSIRAYIERVRLAAAVRELPQGKVEAIAIAAGYRSRKTFYQALARLTGLTPTDYRRLSADDQRQVQQALQG